MDCICYKTLGQICNVDEFPSLKIVLGNSPHYALLSNRIVDYDGDFRYELTASDGTKLNYSGRLGDDINSYIRTTIEGWAKDLPSNDLYQVKLGIVHCYLKIDPCDPFISVKNLGEFIRVLMNDFSISPYELFLSGSFVQYQLGKVTKYNNIHFYVRSDQKLKSLFETSSSFYTKVNSDSQNRFFSRLFNVSVTLVSDPLVVDHTPSLFSLYIFAVRFMQKLPIPFTKFAIFPINNKFIDFSWDVHRFSEVSYFKCNDVCVPSVHSNLIQRVFKNISNCRVTIASAVPLNLRELIYHQLLSFYHYEIEVNGVIHKILPFYYAPLFESGSCCSAV